MKAPVREQSPARALEVLARVHRRCIELAEQRTAEAEAENKKAADGDTSTASKKEARDYGSQSPS